MDVRYSWHWEGAITAEVQSVDSNRSLSYTSSLYPEAASTIKPQLIEGLWWRINEKTGAFLRVTNITASPQRVKLAVLGSSPVSTSKNKRISLAPWQTRLLDLSDLLRQMPGDAGGVRLSFTGPQGAVIADGGLEDAAEGFSANLNLTPNRETRRPRPEMMVRMASVGVMLGKPDPSDQFPEQVRFHPYTYIRNVSAAKRTISVGANYMYGASARSVHLADLVLQPGSSSKVDVEAALTALAAVFHLMRVVEFGLRALCDDLGVTEIKKGPVEYATWDAILQKLPEHVDKKINAMSRSPKKQAAQAFYFPALKEINGFEDAWRNHIMHSRSAYNSADSLAVFSHVDRFMRSLAEYGLRAKRNRKPVS